MRFADNLVVAYCFWATL